MNGIPQACAVLNNGDVVCELVNDSRTIKMKTRAVSFDILYANALQKISLKTFLFYFYFQQRATVLHLSVTGLHVLSITTLMEGGGGIELVN